MPASHDLFAPAEGDTFSRSRSGLAHSDREIEQMREWIEAGDNSLLQVVAALGECLKAAAAAMRPVTPMARPGVRGPFPEEGLMRHEDALSAVARAAEHVVKAAQFNKLPFYERHFIPSGGMPEGLRPKEFDVHRNDEAVYDERRAQAIEAAGKRKQQREEQIAREAAEAERRSEAEEKDRVDQRLIAEFLSEQPAKAKRSFQARLRDPAFQGAAITVIEAVSACIAAAAGLNAEKVARFEQRLAHTVGADPELRAMSRFYLDNAKIYVEQVVESQRMPTANVKKALAVLTQLGKRIEKGVVDRVPTPVKAKKRV